MKYSKKFNLDYEWYLSVSEIFSFDGTKDYISKDGVEIIQHDNNGISAKECFYLYDTKGVVNATSQPDELRTLLKTKGSVNLHIKMYAEDRAQGRLPLEEFDKIKEELNLPTWFVKAVENQKYKILNIQPQKNNKFTVFQEREFSKSQVKKVIEEAEMFHKGSYKSHVFSKTFNQALGIDMHLLEVTIKLYG